MVELLLERVISNLEYQSPEARRPLSYRGRMGAIIGTMVFGIVAPAGVALYAAWVSDVMGRVPFWVALVIMGSVLGWLIGAGVDAVREFNQARRGIGATPQLGPSWRQRLNQRGGQIAAWLIAVGIIGFFELWLLSFGLFGSRISDQAVIERNGGFRVTSAVRDINASIEGWQDPTFRARLIVKPADLPAFLRNTAVTQPLSSSSIPEQLSWKPVDHYTRRWWNPRLPPAKYEAGEGTWVYQNEEGEKWNRRIFMLIDETDPAQSILWIVAYHGDDD